MPIINDDKKKLALDLVDGMITVKLKKLIGLKSKDSGVAVARASRVAVIRPTVSALRVGAQATGGVTVRIGDGSDSSRRARARLSNLGAAVSQLPTQKRRAIVKAQESISDARRSAEMHEGQLRIN